MSSAITATVLTPEELLDHWQAHRRLTRRVIEAFPENALFSYSIGGMRPFSELAREMMGMCGAGIHGIARGEWIMTAELDYHSDDPGPTTRRDLLVLWDQVTRDIDVLWPTIPVGRFQEVDAAFGDHEGPVWTHVFYFIDNEIHHRGQGYVYLRSLGIPPPEFWDR